MVTTQPTCTEEGIETRECVECGVTERQGVAKAEHKWNAGTVITQPTTESEGVMKYSCRVCGTTRTSAIAKLSSADTAPEESAVPEPEESPVPSETSAAEGGKNAGKPAPSGEEKKGGLTRLVQDPSPVDAQESGTAPWLLPLLIAAAAVLAAIVFLMVRKRKRRNG